MNNQDNAQHVQIDLLDTVTLQTPEGSFNKHWNSGTYHAPPRETELANHHQTILNLLVETRDTQDKGWLGDLTQEVESINRRRNPESPEESLPNEPSMREWMRKIFDDFEMFGATFNETNAGSELFVNCSPPEPNTSDIAGQRSFEPDPSMQDDQLPIDGYLSTKHWAMLLRGIPDRISVFILPAEALLGFRSSTISESDYPPLFEMIRARELNYVGWKIGDKWITFEQLTVLSTQLFSDFVRLAAVGPTETEAVAETVAASLTHEPSTPATETPIAIAAEGNRQEAAGPATLLDPAVVEACKVITIVVDQNVHRLLQQSKSAIEKKQFDDFYEIQKLVERLGTLKTNVGETYSEIASANR